MPELPEVETTVQGIHTTTKGLKIVDVWTNYFSDFYKNSDHVKNPRYFKYFRRTVIQSSIVGAERRGKHVLIHLSNKYTIVVHMKMTGHFLYGVYVFNKKDTEWKTKEKGALSDVKNQWIRLVFSLSNGKHLVLSDLRKFATVSVIETSVLRNSQTFRALGFEPLDKKLTFVKFLQILSTRSSGKIKTVLMDQQLIVGIGNIYSDEILWRAGVHPESIVLYIPKRNMRSIYNTMKQVLRKGIHLGGDSDSDYRNVYGEKGEFQNTHKVYRKQRTMCVKKNCKGMIQRKIVGARSAHFCSIHQVLYVQ